SLSKPRLKFPSIRRRSADRLCGPVGTADSAISQARLARDRAKAEALNSHFFNLIRWCVPAGAPSLLILEIRCRFRHADSSSSGPHPDTLDKRSRILLESIFFY